MLTFVFFTHLLGEESTSDRGATSLSLTHQSTVSLSRLSPAFISPVIWLGNGYMEHINPSASISQVLTPNNTLPPAVKQTRDPDPFRERVKERERT